jgi:hypothetical protein
LNNLPEVRIRFGWLVYENISKPLAEKDGIKLPPPDEVLKKVQLYRGAWKPMEQKILQGMFDCYGLEFHGNVIDVYIAPWVRHQSTPLLLNTEPDPDQLIDILTHELFHILLTDNMTYKDSRKLGKVWSELYHGVDILTRNHIWVHAGLKYIFLDVLHDESRLKRDIAKCQRWPGYARAWSIVEAEGYKELINKFKEQYPALQAAEEPAYF